MGPAEATLVQFLALPEGHRFELVRGTLIEKAAPTFEHGLAQRGVDRTVGGRFARRPGSGGQRAARRRRLTRAD